MLIAGNNLLQKHMMQNLHIEMKRIHPANNKMCYARFMAYAYLSL